MHFSRMTSSETSSAETALNFSSTSTPSCRSSTKTTTTTALSTAAAQVASLYLQHQQKQFASAMIAAAVSTAVATSTTASTKSDTPSDWSRRATSTTATTSQQFATSPATTAATSPASNARRFSTSSERDDGLYSMSSVSVDLGESAARSSKHHHTFNKPDPRPLHSTGQQQQRTAAGTFERAGKYSSYFDLRGATSSGSQASDYAAKRYPPFKRSPTHPVPCQRLPRCCVNVVIMVSFFVMIDVSLSLSLTTSFRTNHKIFNFKKYCHCLGTLKQGK